jgi:hypothetical protein
MMVDPFDAGVMNAQFSGRGLVTESVTPYWFLLQHLHFVVIILL